MSEIIPGNVSQLWWMNIAGILYDLEDQNETDILDSSKIKDLGAALSLFLGLDEPFVGIQCFDNMEMNQGNYSAIPEVLLRDIFDFVNHGSPNLSRENYPGRLELTETIDSLQIEPKEWWNRFSWICDLLAIEIRPVAKHPDSNEFKRSFTLRRLSLSFPFNTDTVEAREKKILLSGLRAIFANTPSNLDLGLANYISSSGLNVAFLREPRSIPRREHKFFLEGDQPWIAMLENLENLLKFQIPRFRPKSLTFELSNKRVKTLPQAELKERVSQCHNGLVFVKISSPNPRLKGIFYKV